MPPTPAQAILSLGRDIDPNLPKNEAGVNGGGCQNLTKIAPMSALASRFLGGGEVIPRPDWVTPPHQHPFHELIVVIDGAMYLEAENQTIRGEAGDLLFYRAGCVH